MGNKSIYNEYYNQICKIPLLSLETERELFYRLEQGEVAVRDQIINSNLRLVVNIASRYLNFDVDIMDVISCGNMALIKAVDTFSLEKGNKFSTYAYPYILGILKREFGFSDKKLPEYLKSAYFKYKKIVDNNLKYSDQELIDILQISKKNLDYLKEFYNINFVSLDTTIFYDDKDLYSVISVEDNSYENVIGNIDLEILKSKLKKVLSNYEYYVIYNRYIISPSRTLDSLSQEFNVSKETIRLLENSVLKKIKRELYSGVDNISVDYKSFNLPISFKDVILFYTLKNTIDNYDYYLFYNIYFNIMSLDRLSSKLFVSVDFIKFKYNQIYLKFNELLSNYSVISEKLLKNNTSRKIMDFDIDPVWDYNLEHISNISYKQVIDSDFYNLLNDNQKKLLYKYFNVSDMWFSSYDLSVCEREINLKLMGYSNTTVRVNKDILYKTYISNKDQFSIEKQALIECFIFKTMKRSMFEEITNHSFNKRYTSTYVNFAYTTLEKLYFGIHNIFENKLDYDVIVNLLNDDSVRISSSHRNILKMFYGVGSRKYSIKELSEINGLNYNVMHDMLANAKTALLNNYLSLKTNVIEIDKSLYVDMINDLSYEFTDESRKILYDFIVLNKTYSEISYAYKITKYKVSNIITDGIRRLDMYRYNILSVDSKCDCEVVFDDYVNELNAHVTDSVLNDFEKQIVSYYYGISFGKNLDSKKLSRSEIVVLMDIDAKKLNSMLSNINRKIKNGKMSNSFPKYSRIRREELSVILSDSRLPISSVEREILCHLKEIDGYPLLSEKEIATKYKITTDSLYRKYLRTILTIKKYMNGEIEGIYSYYDDIVPVLKYFPLYDKKILELIYKDNLNSVEIASTLNITRDQAFGNIRRVQKNLTSILKDVDVISKFDFDYARKVFMEPDLPLNLDKELSIHIFNLFFGEYGEKRKSIPEIQKILNLNISSTVLNNSIYDVMLAAMKYKMGYRGGKNVSYQQVRCYYEKYIDSITSYEKNCLERFIFSCEKNLGYTYRLPNAIKYKILCENYDVPFSFKKSTKSDVIKILKDKKYNFSSKTINILKSYYKIPDREFMNSREISKSIKLLSKFDFKEKVKKKSLFN